MYSSKVRRSHPGTECQSRIRSRHFHQRVVRSGYLLCASGESISPITIPEPVRRQRRPRYRPVIPAYDIVRVSTEVVIRHAPIHQSRKCRSSQGSESFQVPIPYLILRQRAVEYSDGLDEAGSVVGTKSPEVSDTESRNVSGTQVSIMGSVFRYLYSVKPQCLSISRCLYPSNVMEIIVRYYSCGRGNISICSVIEMCCYGSIGMDTKPSIIERYRNSVRVSFRHPSGNGVIISRHRYRTVHPRITPVETPAITLIAPVGLRPKNVGRGSRIVVPARIGSRTVQEIFSNESRPIRNYEVLFACHCLRGYERVPVRTMKQSAPR